MTYMVMKKEEIEMKFILFVEGYTENKSIHTFLKRWLDPKLSMPVGIKTVRFDGWSELVKDSPKKAELYLSRKDVIAVIALLDLYGPNFYPTDKVSAKDRYTWAKDDLEKKVNQSNFYQFFAVHEVEAWLFSDPTIFPIKIKNEIKKIKKLPEDINSGNPPAKQLNALYRTHTNRRYKKVTDGINLFPKLDPSIAYEKCPHLRELLDKMESLAKGAMDCKISG